MFNEANKEMIDSILSMLAWVGGAIVGMHFAQPDNFKEGVIYFITALCCAIFLGGWAIEYWELGSRASSAVGFLVAIAGVYIVRGVVVFATKFSKNPLGAIKELLNFYKENKKDGNNENS